MRCLVLGLFAVGIPGCNAIFGIEPTVPVDAGIDVIELPIDAKLPTARLTYLVTHTQTNGVPVTAPAIEDVTPTPSVQIGRLDGPLTPAIYQAGGYIDVPYDYPGTPWRLVYTVGSDTHEVQFTAESTAPHAVIPRFGRIERAMIPGPNSAYAVSPAGFDQSHLGLRVYTTGMWTSSLTNTSSGTLIQANINAAVPFSGPAGAPELAKGDQVAIIDYQSTGPCTNSRKSIVFRAELGTGASAPAVTPPWPLTYPARILTFADPPIAAGRLQAALGSAAGPTIQSRKRFGLAVNVAMPAFTQAALGWPLPVPAMVTLLDCLAPTSTADHTYGQVTQLPFDGLAHTQITNTRGIAGGATLASGIEGVVPDTGSDSFIMDLSVGIPRGFKLGDLDLTVADDVLLPAPPPFLELTFDLDTGTAAHYYTVILHRVQGPTLVPVRTYTLPASTEPKVTIDTSLLESANRYVFEVRAFKGAPGAPTGDFTEYDSTQSSAVIYTRPFIAP